MVEPAPTTAAAPQETPTTEADEPVEPDEPPTTVEEDDPSEEMDAPVGPDDIDPAEVDDAQDRVERINLTSEDLPAEWVSEPADDEIGSVLQTCTTSGVDENVVARDRSDRFSLPTGSGGGLGLDTSSGYLVDEATAEDLVAELGSDAFAACATEELLSADGVTIEGALSPVDGLSGYGDEVVALQGGFDLSDETGATAHLDASVIAIRTDQVLTIVSATALDTEGDEALLAQVLDLVAERQEL